MTNSDVSLTTVKTYDGNHQIQRVDGTSLHISVIGDISPSLPNVFVSPNLSTNLIFVGQLVAHDYNVHFSRFGCIVRDQVSEKIILKGPKVGR
ncbi:hypothetical protein VIGAN_04147100, partial [Vigna angularis var. angularis]